jgi:hypothetical protein
MPKSPPPPASYKIRRRWTTVEARAALAALASSGLSQRAFATREGLDTQRLGVWRRKLGVAVTAPPPSFVEVRPRAAERIELVLPSGVTLRVAESIDAALLRHLVDALDRASPC